MQARISFDHDSTGALKTAVIMEPVITSAEQCANLIATLLRIAPWFNHQDSAKGGLKKTGTDRINGPSMALLGLPAPNKRGPYKKKRKPDDEQETVANGTMTKLEIAPKGIKTTMVNGEKRYFYLMYIPAKARDGNTAITYKLGPNGTPKYDYYLSPERAKGSKQVCLYCDKHGVPFKMDKVTEIQAAA